jgi:hypothetical protein
MIALNSNLQVGPALASRSRVWRCWPHRSLTLAKSWPLDRQQELCACRTTAGCLEAGALLEQRQRLRDHRSRSGPRAAAALVGRAGEVLDAVMHSLLTPTPLSLSPLVDLPHAPMLPAFPSPLCSLLCIRSGMGELRTYQPTITSR